MIESKTYTHRRGSWPGWLALGMVLILTASLACGTHETPGTGKKGQSGAKEGQTVVVLTPHGQEMLDEYAHAFEAAHPGIHVVGRFVPTGQILAQLRIDQAAPTVDVWWGGTSAFFEQARGARLLEPYRPSWAAASPPGRHALDDSWYGQFLELPAILYNRNIYQPNQIPATWEALLAPAWREKLVFREPLDSGTMKTIFAGLIWLLGGAGHDPAPGLAYLKALDAQTKAYLPNPQALYDRIAKSPEGYLSLWNVTDINYQSRVNGYPFGYKLPQGPLPVSVDPIALVARAPHPGPARLFYEFVTSRENSLRMARDHDRILARDDVTPAELPAWQRELNVSVLELDRATFDELQVGWMERWRQEVRNPAK